MLKSRGRLRLASVAAVVVAAVPVAQASAAVTPTLSASSTATESTITYNQGVASDPASKMIFYVPSGFTSLLAFPEGEAIGTVTARATAADVGTSVLDLSGIVTSQLGTTAIAGSTLAQRAAACTGTATHSAFWLLNLTVQGQPFLVPAYLDDITLANPLTDIANTAITVCLPPPDVPAGTPSRALLGVKLFQMAIHVNTFSAPPESYVWRVITTPYAPGTGAINASGAVEAQSVDRTPQELTLAFATVKKKVATLSGRLTAGGKGISGGTVRILSGKKVIATAKTKAGGRYKTTVRLPRASMLLKATATVATTNGGTCSSPIAPACSGQSLAGFTVAATTSAKVKT